MTDLNVQVGKNRNLEGSNIDVKKNLDNNKKLETKSWHIIDEILCFNNK